MRIKTSEFIEDQRDGLITALDIMSVPGSSGTDGYMNAFAPAMARILMSKEPLLEEEIFAEVLAMPEEPERRAHKFMRAAQKPLMRYVPSYLRELPQARHLVEKDIQPPAIAFAYDYPSPEFLDEDYWEQVIRESWEDDNVRLQFRFDNQLFQLMTNRAERGKSLKLAMSAFADRFQNPTAIEIGGSMGQIPKQIILNDKYPYRPTPAGKFGSANRSFVEAPALSSDLDKILTSDTDVSEFWYVDLHRQSDLEHVMWARACWRPSDLLNPRVINRYDNLNKENPLNLHYATGDFSKPYPEGMADPLPNYKFDFVFTSTTAHQLTYEQQKQFLNNLEALAHERSVLVYQDFFMGEPDEASPRATHEIYHPEARYLTLVKDMEQPDKGYQPFAEWDSGSCNKVEFLSGATALRGLGVGII